MSLPKDPVMLLSYVNTKLRDNYLTLDDFIKAENLSYTELSNKLNSINYFYDEKLNKFI